MTTTAVEVQRRYLTIDKPQADADQLEFSFSSETPVTRYFGDEVLDHDRQAVDLSRLNGGAAPLLLNHDPDRVLGIVERAWIDEKRRGMARIQWATNDLAIQVRKDVEAGVMSNISVGYSVLDAEKEGEVMVVRKWQPIELSVVSIPADASIGVNRAKPSTTHETMTQFLQSLRGFVGFAMFVLALLMTFKGFPGGLLSWLGGGVVTVAYSVAIATITHEDTGQGKEGPRDRFLRICLAFAIASVGAAMVEWGGLWSVTFFDTLNIPFRETGIVIGIVCGLFNIDKTTQIPGNHQQAK